MSLQACLMRCAGFPWSSGSQIARVELRLSFRSRSGASISPAPAAAMDPGECTGVQPGAPGELSSHARATTNTAAATMAAAAGQDLGGSTAAAGMPDGPPRTGTATQRPRALYPWAMLGELHADHGVLPGRGEEQGKGSQPDAAGFASSGAFESSLAAVEGCTSLCGECCCGCGGCGCGCCQATT
jgi:hypothetical protein